MSFQPEVAHALNHLWNSQYRSQQEPASIIVPLHARQYTQSNSDNNAQRIFADHSNLPPMADTEFYDHSAMTHNLMNEFAYECMLQQESGAFHLIVQLFMSSNDRFFIETDWDNMTQSNTEYWMHSNNHLIVTRLSRNPYYASAHEQYVD